MLWCRYISKNDKSVEKKKGRIHTQSPEVCRVFTFHGSLHCSKYSLYEALIFGKTR